MIWMVPLFYLFELGPEVLLHGGSRVVGCLRPFPCFKAFLFQ